MLQKSRLASAMTGAALLLGCAAIPAFAQTAQTTDAQATDPQTTQTTTAPPPPSPPVVNSLADYFNTWSQRVAWARATQPEFSSPIVTTTSILEERVRFETQFQHSGNDTDTIDIDGGKGVDLIVGDTQEIQIALPPYYIRSAPTHSGDFSGFNDWNFFRFKQRLFSSPKDEGNFVVSAFVQVGAPIGIAKLTNHAWTLSPTLGFGKGFGKFVVQGTVGGVLPTAYQGKIGNQIQTNMAFQYNLVPHFWPQVEVNWTYYPDGPRAHLSQVYLTPGFTISRIELSKSANFTIGLGYEVAVAPDYRAKPLLPTFDRSWIISTRVNF